MVSAICADASGYPYSLVWVGKYALTGEFINWAAENGIVAIGVELPDGNVVTTVPVGHVETYMEAIMRSLIAVLRGYAVTSR